MSKAVAFLAGLGAGYVDGSRRNKEYERAEKREKREQDAFDANQRDRAQDKADKDAVRAAAAPVTVESGETYQPVNDDDGNPMPANPTAGTFRVGASRFADQGVATAEAAKQNSPDANRTRVAAALAAQGNVLGADQLRTSGIQAAGAQAQLDENIRTQQGREFARGVATSLATEGWKGFAKFATDKYNDDNVYSAVEDGKGGAIIISKSKDGKEVGRVPFASPEDAIMYSVGRADPAKWVEYKAGRDDRKAAQAVAQQNADTNEQYRKDQAANMKAQRELEEKRITALTAKAAAPGGPIRLELKDMRDFESDLTAHIKEQYPVKEGADPAERAAMNAQATARKALANSIFQSNAEVGTPLVAATVLQAMELAQVRGNIRMTIDGREAVVVNGQVVIVSGQLQKRDAAAPPAVPLAGQRAERAAQVAQAGVQPQAAPAQAAPAQAAPAQAAPAPAQVAAAPAPAQVPPPLVPLNAAVERATAMMAAAAQSSDPAAISMYSKVLEAARAARIKEAMKQLGRIGGAEYLQANPM